MDIVAHGLWAGLGVAAVSQRRPVGRRAGLCTVVLALLPDLLHMLPLLPLALGPDGIATLMAYAVALPGSEPPLPDAVALLSHHLHCASHSAVMAALLSGWICWRRGAWWWPLCGWWSHIVLDVFTHSAGFYPSPVLYPLTYAGFDGIAWNTPWFQVLNYGAITVAGVLLLRWRRRR